MRTRIAAVLSAPLLFLTACEEEAPEADTSETGGEAAGEVLGGTISDDMIALEELTSTSPPAERVTPERGTDGTAPAASAEPDPESEGETQEAETSDEEAPAPDESSSEE